MSMSDPSGAQRHPRRPRALASLRRAGTGLALLALTLIPERARAQATTPQEALIWRLDAPSRHQVEVLFDSATRLGLPAELLYSKTLEGISKGANGRRIVENLRKYLASMREARAALGAGPTDELAAATGALLAGVDRDELPKLRKSRGGRSIAVPLVILSDLVSRGVPTRDAAGAMVQLSQRGALDSDLHGLWLRINQDIVSGVPPAAALQRWTRDFPGRGAPGTRLPPGTAPPTTAAPRVPEPPSTTAP